jgi:hypothetical protein
LNFVCALSEKLEMWGPINESQIHKICGGRGEGCLKVKNITKEKYTSKNFATSK